MELAPVYPILDVPGCRVEDHEIPTRAVALAAAGCTLIQLRAKTLKGAELFALATKLARGLARQRCVLVINDRLDIALAVAQATGQRVGVHLGLSDVPAVAARRMLGTSAVVGVSTHDPAQAASADPTVADYAGFGPVFDSPTKPGVRHPRGVAALARACAAARLPLVAIGGVTLERAPALFAAGAASLAVIRDLKNAPDAGELARRYRQAFLATRSV